MSEIPPLPEKKSNVGKIIGCGCGAIILLGIIGAAVMFMGFTKIMKSNAPYKDSIAAVEKNTAAVAALGEPIKPGLVPTGNISTTNGEGEVDLSIGVSGPKGTGTIIVKGTKAAGGTGWKYDTWELKVDGQEAAIPLP